MKDIIDAYYEARQALVDAFGIDEAEYFEYHASDEFYFYEADNMIEYSSFIDDDLYSYETAILITVVDGYQLYRVTDNGQTFYAIFHSDKELDDEHAEIKFG